MNPNDSAPFLFQSKSENQFKNNNAVYVADLCLKDRDGNWANEPAAIFYQENPPTGYSNYFAIIVRGQQTFIASGISAVEQPIVGILAIAGSLVQKKKVAVTAGTLSTSNAMFVFLLIFIVILVGALNFFPALSLGPIAEYFSMIS